MNEKIVHKVHLLLNKATNNSSKEEAQACLLMAQKLMVEHDISQSEVDIHSEEKECLKKAVRIKTNYERLPWWKKGIARVISENFRCYHYTNRIHRKSSVVFLGLDQDAELAKLTFEFACDAIKYGLKIFAKERKVQNMSTSTGMKNDYMSGWIQGLKDKFKEQVDKCNWGLILVKDALVTQEYETMNLKKGRASSIVISGSSSARSAGYRDGKNFSSPSGRLNA
ncbi:DUF2786 domain-containing protein [Desulfosporosinus youngiae]|uniref:Uncharacterized protein n=1 Tax=Desulfosporosinus youngiae DSM 17734 TaxID=768710 RepID=H5Y2Q1_9FIRM|nr:DUF2786 domain-containing protein [Desulfosporosinus youngiae]EHQ88314.1 Protein of unknown function (DUF2786) [Desulfosporosinus youngiae DSM 17734]